MKAQRWVFDSINARVIVEDDTYNVLYINNLDCSDDVIQKIVDIHNSNINNINLSDIDNYLLNELGCSQEDREEILESLFSNYYSNITI